MPKLKEELLQFIWKARLLKPVELHTVGGSPVEIVSPGEENTDSGPDFFNARIRVNGTLLAGNVELHIRTSDWTRHKHERDRQYDNIILHVVYRHDKLPRQNKEHGVEVLALEKYIDPLTITRYEELSRSGARLPCSLQLRHVNDKVFTSWLRRMTEERLRAKTERTEAVFETCRKDYSQTIYTKLLRNFGFKVNALPFELVASRLPVAMLLRHADRLEEMEALLFGIAGMLDEQLSHPYAWMLQNEFAFLRSKYKLQPLDRKLFKFSKMRPANFPSIRLAQLAALLHRHPELVTRPHLEIELIPEKVRDVQTSPFWHSHYTLDGAEVKGDLAFGGSSVENILINTFAPFLYFYGGKTAKPEIQAEAVRLLTSCSAESNFKTRMFIVKAPLIKSGADSQALIHLYDNYCSLRRCMHCSVAASLLNPGQKA